MAHASPNKRKLRRMKRERTLAFKMAELALDQRDVARLVADKLANELKRVKGGVTIEKVEDESETNQTDRPDEDSSGLEVSEV